MVDGTVIRQLLDAGLDDWVPLHDVTWGAMHGDASEKSKATALRILGQLFDDRLFVPGDLGESGFEDWPGSSDEWIERARAELERLDWSPMGAGFWLRLTDLGERTARALGLP